MTGILGSLPSLFQGAERLVLGLLSASKPAVKKGPGLHRTAVRASTQHKPFRLSLKCSEQGLKFIFSFEVGPKSKLTAHPHWPGGSSGVTLIRPNCAAAWQASTI